MSNSIRSIKLEFEQAKFRELSVLYEKYEGDSRSGVQNLIARYKKQEAKLKEERFFYKKLCFRIRFVVFSGYRMKCHTAIQTVWQVLAIGCGIITMHGP